MAGGDFHQIAAPIKRSTGRTPPDVGELGVFAIDDRPSAGLAGDARGDANLENADPAPPGDAQAHRPPSLLHKNTNNSKQTS